MGAESSILNDIELDKTGQTVAGHDGCALHSAKRKDGSRVSVFVYDKSNTNTEFMENAANQLKVLRHPCIVRFLSWNRTSDGHYLLTEPVEPLDVVLERLTVTEICAGIYNIIEALTFLHDRGGLCHNNISLSSIYVGEDGSWKLGGMEYLCRYEQATAAYLNKCRPHRIEQAIPPEEKSGKIRLTSKEYGHAGDAYAFGILAEYFMELLIDLGDMTKTFELRVQDEFLNEDPKLRPKLNTLLQDRLFKNDYLVIKNFLKFITLKSEAEKAEFFSTVVEKLHCLPADIVASRLCKPLLSRFVLLDQTANDCLLPHLLTPHKGDSRQEYKEGELNPVLSESLFKTYIIPELFKIFHVRDAHIRLSLLTMFSAYAHLFDKTTLASIILPQVLLGIRDSNDHLVEASLHALADLVPLLGGDTVIGSNRGRIFVQSIPKFGGDQGEISNGALSSNKVQLSKKGILKSIRADQAPVEMEHKREKTLKEIAREADKERRREEAKKRREERKKLRQEESNKTTELAENNSPSRTLTTHDSDPRTFDPSAEHDVRSVPSSGWAERHSDEENTKANWSDWSGVDEDNNNEDANIDGEISKEIELELQAMDTSYSPTKALDSDKLVAGSDENPPTVSNRTASMPLSSNRALKLKNIKTKSSPPPESRVETVVGKTQLRSDGANRMNTNSSHTTDGGWDTNWDTDGENMPSSNETSPSHAPPPVQDNLGAEFDVLSIDVKKTSEPSEFDFFSDMEPVIPKKPSFLETLAVANKSQNSAVDATTVLNTKLKFAATESLETESAGWGDDGLDWGDVDDLEQS